MKYLLLLIALAFILGLRSVLSLLIGALLGYLLGYLLVLSGTGAWVIPFLTIVMGLALSRRIKRILELLFY